MLQDGPRTAEGSLFGALAIQTDLLRNLTDIISTPTPTAEGREPVGMPASKIEAAIDQIKSNNGMIVRLTELVSGLRN